MMKGTPAPGGASSNTRKSPCSGDFGCGFSAIDEAAHPPPPTLTTQKYRQVDGSVFFLLINKIA